MPSGGPSAVGVDIGGTNLRAARVGVDGVISGRVREPTPAPTSDGVDHSSALAAAIARVARSIGPGLPVGVGVAALVDRNGTLMSAPNLAVVDLPLGDELRDDLDVPVVVGHDATVAGVAEHRLGAGRGHDDLAMLTLGTGVGGCLIHRGRPVTGAHGFGSELGHLLIDPGGPPCACGQLGCLEAYASGSAIRRAAVAAHADTVNPSVLQDREPESLIASHVTEAAGAGDQVAISILESAGHALGLGIAVIANMLDPGRIVVGGGMAVSAAPWMLPAARRSFAARVLGGPARPLPDVVLARLGDDAGMIGAALLAHDRASPHITRPS